MKDKATLIAVSGVVGLLFAVIGYYAWSGVTLDAELIKMGITNLMSFAGGAAVTYAAVGGTDKGK